MKEFWKLKSSNKLFRKENLKISDRIVELVVDEIYLISKYVLEESDGKVWNTNWIYCGFVHWYLSCGLFYGAVITSYCLPPHDPTVVNVGTLWLFKVLSHHLLQGTKETVKRPISLFGRELKYKCRKYKWEPLSNNSFLFWLSLCSNEPTVLVKTEVLDQLSNYKPF